MYVFLHIIYIFTPLCTYTVFVIMSFVMHTNLQYQIYINKHLLWGQIIYFEELTAV